MGHQIPTTTLVITWCDMDLESITFTTPPTTAAPSRRTEAVVPFKKFVLPGTDPVTIFNPDFASPLWDTLIDADPLGVIGNPGINIRPDGQGNRFLGLYWVMGRLTVHLDTPGNSGRLTSLLSDGSITVFNGTSSLWLEPTVDWGYGAGSLAFNFLTYDPRNIFVEVRADIGSVTFIPNNFDTWIQVVYLGDKAEFAGIQPIPA